MPENAADILARIKPTLREHIEWVCLRPDLLDKFHELETELTTLRVDRAGSARLGTGISDKERELAAELVDVEQQITEGSMRIHLTALPTDKFEELVAKYPPRKGNDYDMLAGYDRQAVQDVILRKCIDDPVFDDASWAEFRSVCPVGEMGGLRETLQILHPGAAVLPKSLLAAEILSGEDSASKSPRLGAQPPANSTDGPPEKSTPPNTTTQTES